MTVERGRTAALWCTFEGRRSCSSGLLSRERPTPSALPNLQRLVIDVAREPARNACPDGSIRPFVSKRRRGGRNLSSRGGVRWFEKVVPMPMFARTNTLTFEDFAAAAADTDLTGRVLVVAPRNAGAKIKAKG